MTGAVERDDECVVKRGIVRAEERKAKWRAVRGEGGVGRGYVVAGGKRRGHGAELRIGVDDVSLSAAGGDQRTLLRHAGLCAVDGVGVFGWVAVAGGAGVLRALGLGGEIAGGRHLGERRLVEGRFALREVAGGPAVVGA